ncbi:hypothetical protein [Alloalcanivorax gelatiniphagus]|uniref:Sulfotransferase family protein n=1 Tax=Alloalcanivorax gelatiniphagus TaxID=1194167 RepID=A0ABY2XNN2_9GAMM|nr:hypothetical protein [Alloalcanivorax gelatiniphagus]TMW13659.1 hypothetical protein FGS76_05880 [Alloalcanivorax gelatiniphagus]|tara:strand:+ start:7759 stop:8862 length:1104 start_codon:yes stop_codon:yes gene_type:complete
MFFNLGRRRPGLYLHIGQPKSGTTSLQDFLSLEREQLREQGFLYPRLSQVENENAHHALSYDVREETVPGLRMTPHDPSRNARVWEQLARAVRHTACPTVILSSEDFYFLDDNGARRRSAVALLANRLKPLFSSVTVVAYLRRQDEHVESWCNELVKYGFRRNTHDIATLAESLPACHSDYHMLRQLWVRSFGEDAVVFRAFRRDRLKNGSIVDDFCELVGYQPSSRLADFSHRNLRLTRLGFEVTRHLNRFEHSLPVHRRAVDLIRELAVEPPGDPGAEAPFEYFREPLRDKWRRSNRALRLDFSDPLLEQRETQVRPYCLWQPPDLEALRQAALRAALEDDRCAAAAGALVAAAIDVMRTEYHAL